MAAPYKVFDKKLWINITKQQVDALDRLSRLYGGCRADHVRWAIDEYVERERRKVRRGAS